MSDVRQGPVKWHAILGYELLWRKSPEATESFEVKAIFFSFLFMVSPGWRRKSGDAHQRLNRRCQSYQGFLPRYHTINT